MRTRLGPFFVAAATLVCGGRALAQDAKAGSVVAYDDAERLAAEGKFGEACPKYAESQRLDPQLGTLLHLADCLEQNGQTASAWASFRDAAELAEKRGDSRRELANQRIAALVPKLSRLQINVPAGVELHVERDGIVVGRALFGAPVPMDPGPHSLSASAPGRQTWTGKVVVPADGSITTVAVPRLETQVPTSPEASSAPTALTTNEAGRDAPEGKSLLAGRWPALAAGAVGVAGIAVGSVFGLKSMSKAKQADAHCAQKTCSDDDGVTLSSDAVAAGNVSTVGFVVGGVALAAGAVLWFTLPAGTQTSAQTNARRLRVGLAPAAVTLGATW